MGTAHLTSFINAKLNYNITVVDTNSVIKKLKNKFLGISIKYQEKLPNKNFFDLAIIATGSIERFLVSCKIINNNFIKIILLEKFVFLKKNNYEKFSKLLNKNKTKCYVNCWGTSLSNILKFSKMIKKNSIINITINNRSYLTNLIHILNLIFDSIPFNRTADYKLLIKKIFSAKFKNYHEIAAQLSFYSIYKNIYINISSVNQKNTFEVKILNKKEKSTIFLNKNLKLVKIFNNKIKKYNFPLSSIYSEKIYRNINNNNYHYKFISYNYATDLSLLILNLINKHSKKKLVIR